MPERRVPVAPSHPAAGAGGSPARMLMLESDALSGVLLRARQLLDWEGENIVPAGPQEALIEYLTRHRSKADPLVLGVLYILRALYGAGVARVRRQVERYSAAVERFAAWYGRGELAIARAPARINILGEHVDYVRYLPTEVLPFASREHDMLMLFRPVEEAEVRGRSTLDGTDAARFGLDEGPAPHAGPPESLEDHWIEYLRSIGAPPRHWSNYVKAGVFFCRAKDARVRRGFEFLLDSTIPAAGGASSSSAVVVLAGAAIRVSNDLPVEAAELAADSSLAEWYIGTRGGTMDHATMCLARRQQALHIGFTPPRTEQVPLHRFRYRWMTFFAHPADKSGDVMLEYNERSAVSRLLIPALLERLFQQEPSLGEAWRAAVRGLAEDPEKVSAAEKARDVLERLPESVTLGEVAREWPHVHHELKRAYPRLAQQPPTRVLKVRPRALHHAGEVVRVREAVRILKEVFGSREPEAPEKTEPGLRAVGDLITEAHESLRDRYELCTPDINALADILLDHPGVYGARLMGGGFGGNILALVSKEHVAELVERVQQGYYRPRGRDAVAEGSVMVSTPGEGFGMVCLRDVLEQAVVNASAIWWKWRRHAQTIEQCLCRLLDIESLADFAPVRPVQPVIVAGGRDRSDSQKGYRSPSSLTRLGDKTALDRVLEAIGGLPFDTRPPVVVVSPGTEKAGIERLGLPPEARVVVQPRPLGTAHAVLCALEAIPDGGTDALVVWGSQPLLSSETLARSVMVHQALRSAAMLFPTAVTRTPYAPIQRDLRGYVIASRETRAEGAPTKRLGETNVGAFILGCETLHANLREVHHALWDQASQSYRTPSGLLGFPNEMARALVSAGRAVIALPIARVEESLGLRDRAGYQEVRRILHL